MPENNAKTSVKTGPNRQMLRRTLFLMAVCGIAAFLILLGRLYKLQIADHEYYEKLAISQQLREAPTAAARGKISARMIRRITFSGGNIRPNAVRKLSSRFFARTDSEILRK